MLHRPAIRHCMPMRATKHGVPVHSGANTHNLPRPPELRTSSLRRDGPAAPRVCDFGLGPRRRARVRGARPPHTAAPRRRRGHRGRRFPHGPQLRSRRTVAGRGRPVGAGAPSSKSHTPIASSSPTSARQRKGNKRTRQAQTPTFVISSFSFINLTSSDYGWLNYA